ncbi:MAG: O-antigen ligase family protein [Labedaea sp.]
MATGTLDRVDFLGAATPRRADGATLAVVFAVCILVIPARLVLKGLPLSLTPANLVALLVALVWLCAQFTTTLGVAKGRSPVRTVLLCYVAGALATYGYATYGYLPVDELNMADHAALLMVASAGLALGVSDGVRGDRIDFLLKGVVLCGAFSALVGVLQFTVNFDLTQYLRLPGLRYFADGEFVFSRSDLRRVGGTMGHPIEFGVVMAMLVPIAAHYGLRAKERGEAPWLWFGSAGVIAMGLMFSVSRSAVLGLAAAGLVLFIGWPTRRRLRALGVVAGFLVLMKIITPGLLGTFYKLFANAGNDDSVRWRTHDYDIAATEIGRHLWLGHGFGTWYAPKFIVFDNQYILTVVEGGVLGIAAFAAVFLIGLYAAVRARYLSTDPTRRDLGLAIAASLVVPLIGSATFDLAAFKTAEGLSFLLIGAAGALLRTADAEVSPLPRPG